MPKSSSGKVSKEKVKGMESEELEAEFKTLAKMLSPINARRKEIDAELKLRTAGSSIDVKIKHFFPSKEDRKAALRKLKKEFGNG